MTTTITGATGVNQITDDAITAAKLPAGSVLKVTQSGTIARTTITSTGAWTATGLSDVITPISTSSKILVMVTVPIRLIGSSASRGGIRLKRGSDVVWNTQPHTEMIQFNVGSENTQLVSMHYVDSPSTTSATTYSIEAYLTTGCLLYTSDAADE